MAQLESKQKHVTGQTEVYLRYLSEVPCLMMRKSHSVNVFKCIYTRLAWCERIGGLNTEQRSSAPWHYVLLAENVLREWQAKGARLAEWLDYARPRPLADVSLQYQLAFQ